MRASSGKPPGKARPKAKTPEPGRRRARGDLVLALVGQLFARRFGARLVADAVFRRPARQ